jgi:hypothetical protein
MLRSCALGYNKIGQIWLIDMDALEAYIEHLVNTSDRRCGSKYFFLIMRFQMKYKLENPFPGKD